MTPEQMVKTQEGWEDINDVNDWLESLGLPRAADSLAEALLTGSGGYLGIFDEEVNLTLTVIANNSAKLKGSNFLQFLKRLETLENKLVEMNIDIDEKIWMEALRLEINLVTAALTFPKGKIVLFGLSKHRH